MQPYQRASEAMRESGDRPLKTIQDIGSNALAIFGGRAASKFGLSAAATIAPKIAALINPSVPNQLSMKGLSKLDPRMGSFINGALEQGFDFNEIREFLGQKIQQSQQTAKPSNLNLIEQYSPELHKFILDHIQKGRSALEAGALAQLDMGKGKSFKNIIEKISKDHKAPWSAIVESVYNNQGAKTQPEQQQSQEVIDPQLAQLIQQGSEIIKRFRGA